MTREQFGTTKNGEKVERLTLENGTLRASILTYGATLNDVVLAGLDRHLTLGGQTVGDYEPGGAFFYAGAIVGPVANRIRDGRCSLDGTPLTLDTNGPAGHMLHGGENGLHQKVWNVETLERDRALLSTSAPDGEGGFPGNRHFEAEFILNGPMLTLKLSATTDAVTLMSLANHSYWNLGAEETFHGHRLQVAADHYLPVDDAAMATGEVADVTDTAFDFRSACTLSETDHLDHNFCLSDARGAIRPIATLTSPDGVSMTLKTTEPGLQVYDARHMPAEGTRGHNGHRNGPRCAVAMEAQFWPDAPNQPEFPQIRLEPGTPWQQVTRWHFDRT